MLRLSLVHLPELSKLAKLAEKEVQVRVAVSGATGFLGAHLVVQCLSQGHEVLAVDIADFSNKEKTLLGGDANGVVETSICDISDFDSVRTLFLKEKVDTVIHAAVVTVLGAEDEEKARLTANVNAIGTLNLLEAVKGSAKRFVYVSSSGIYGSYGKGKDPVPEKAPYVPMGCYVAAKIYSELLCLRFNDFGHYKIAIARIGSPYGPWERPTGTRKLMSPIYNLMEMARNASKALIFGEASVRDWTHMGDIARALVLLATVPSERLNHIIYNISSGVNVSISEIVQAITDVIAGFRSEYVNSAEEANINAYLPNPRGPLDISRISQDCGFQAEYDIRSGIRNYANWLNKYDNA